MSIQCEIAASQTGIEIQKECGQFLAQKLEENKDKPEIVLLLQEIQKKLQEVVSMAIARD